MENFKHKEDDEQFELLRSGLEDEVSLLQAEDMEDIYGGYCSGGYCGKGYENRQTGQGCKEEYCPNTYY